MYLRYKVTLFLNIYLECALEEFKGEQYGSYLFIWVGDTPDWLFCCFRPPQKASNDLSLSPGECPMVDFG